MKGQIPAQRFVAMSHLKTQGLPGIFNVRLISTLYMVGPF
jgi:hypothetical protein